MVAPPPETPPRDGVPPRSRVALVTDAESPVGRATALLLADRGWCVLACGASLAGILDLPRETMAGGLLEIHALAARGGDGLDAPAIAAAMDRAEALYGRLDAVVCVAMDARFGAAEETPEPVARAVFETNFFAPMRALQAAAGRFREARRGRVVCLSSAGSKVALPMSALTSASHHALAGLCGAMRLELRPFGVHVILVEPGFVRRGVVDQDDDALARAFASVPAESPYAPIAEAVAEVARDLFQSAVSPRDVAEVALRALEADKPRGRYAVSRRAAAWLLARKVLPDRMIERRLAKALGLDDLE